MSAKLSELIILADELTRNFSGLEGNIERIKKHKNKQEFTLNQLAVLLQSINEARRGIELYRSEIQLDKEELKDIYEFAWSRLPHIPFYTRYITHTKGTMSFERLGEEEFHYDYLNEEDEEPFWCIELCSMPIETKEFANMVKTNSKELLLIDIGGINLFLVDVENLLFSELKNVTYNRNDLTKSTLDDVLKVFSITQLGLGILNNIDQNLKALSEKVESELEDLVQLLDVI